MAIDKKEMVIPYIEATVNIQISSEEAGRKLFSQLEKDRKNWGNGANLSLPHSSRSDGPTKGYYEFSFSLSISRIQDFKDFLRQFCKEESLQLNLMTN